LTFSDERSGQLQVRNANHMIGVQMSEKKPVHFSPRYLKMHQTLECPAAGVKEKLPIAYFDQSTGTETTHDRGRCARTEKRYLIMLGASFNSEICGRILGPLSVSPRSGVALRRPSLLRFG